MKKLLSTILSVIMILSFTACGTSAEATWQEHYDLGLKYVTEAKYEEAILAFTKALEIDPKQQIVYVALAEVYVRQEKYSNALSVLEEAKDNVDKYASVDSKIDRIEQLVSSSFKNRQDYIEFETMDIKFKDFIEKTADAIINNDMASISDIQLYNDIVNITGEDDYFSCYTIWNEYKLHIQYSNKGIAPSLQIELRQKNGKGYYADFIYDNGVNTYRAECNCIDWQYNGTMSYERNWIRGGESGKSTGQGDIVKNHRHGKYTLTKYNQYGQEDISTETYENGYITLNDTVYWSGIYGGLFTSRPTYDLLIW